MRGCQWRREETERRLISASWYVEAFRRQKRLPDLESVLRPPGEIAEQTDDDILAVLQAFEASGGNNMSIKLVEAPEWLLQ